jgi:hypothetical protein
MQTKRRKPMTPQQIRQAEQRLMQWRASHSNPDSRREAYCREILMFTLNSMSMENEPVNPERLAQLLKQPNLKTQPEN